MKKVFVTGIDGIIAPPSARQSKAEGYTVQGVDTKCPEFKDKGRSKNLVMLGDSLTQSGGIAILQNLMFKYAPPDVNIQQIATHDNGSIVHRVIVFTTGLGRFTGRLLFKRTDFVHIHISDGGSIARKSIVATLAFVFRKPVLIHAHGAVFHTNYSQLPKVAQQVVAKIFRQSKGWIALTSFWRDFYISSLGLDPDRVFILPNPTELPPQVPKRVNSSKIKIVFLGRLCQRKGTFDLIRAFGNLPERLRNCSELILAGDGDIEQCQLLASRLNLARQVSFLGLIDTQERDSLLAKADIYVLPTYNEGLPLALLEAMAWGLPVITTPVSGIPDIVEDNKNGLLANPGDIQKLSEALQLLIENEDLKPLSALQPGMLPLPWT